jgi:coenzyme PQQ precursor peptide PqqA
MVVAPRARNVTRTSCVLIGANWRIRMSEWHKPVVTEQEVGLEVTSYLPAELDN